MKKKFKIEREHLRDEGLGRKMGYPTFLCFRKKVWDTSPSNDAKEQVRKIQGENKKTYNKKHIPNAYISVVTWWQKNVRLGLKFHSKYLGL